MKRDANKAVAGVDRLEFETRVIHAGQAPDPSTGAIMPPIYATSTYVQASPGVHKGLDYGRSHNPTRWALERCVADLEGGVQAFAFASGMSAIATVIESLDAGSHIVAGDDLYGGTFRLFERVPRRGCASLMSTCRISMRSPPHCSPIRRWSGSRRRPIRC
jgi:cystathionine gamma-lyase